MIAYLDSSVLLRLIFGQAGPYPALAKLTHAVSSELIEVECRRSIDRHQTRGALTAAQAARKYEELYAALEGLELIEITRTVLRQAGQPCPVPLGSLDSIHLATCALWRERSGERITLLTHDRELANAARTSGIPAEGA